MKSNNLKNLKWIGLIFLMINMLTLVNSTFNKTFNQTINLKPLSQDSSWAKIVNHTCTDINLIPEEWINEVKIKWNLHFAHTSHGGQLIEGLNQVQTENDTFAFNLYDSEVPFDSDVFDVLDGQISENYITPDLYWQTPEGRSLTTNVLSTEIVNVSMWSWCTQLEYYSEEEVQDYLDNMSAFEAAYPDIIFVYMTGNAQADGDGGYNRFLRNQQIREYCIANNKWLFDFEDLDCWFNGVQKTYTYESQQIPLEHPQFHGDESGHTTYESCKIKGIALWWLMACISGWIPEEYGEYHGQERGIPGFNVGLLIGISLLSVLGILYKIQKTKIKKINV